MANFKPAFDLTMGHEGGYSNDPDDSGGETYRGIARNFHPAWEGWKILDQYVIKDNAALLKDVRLNKLVETFYKAEFWDKFKGDEIPSSLLANELFDTGINTGIQDGIEFLQIGLNVLNRNQALYADMAVDGIFGTATMINLKTYLKTDPDVLLYKVMNVLQGKHYIDIMLKKGSQEKYARGWFNRVEISKGGK